MVDFLWYRKNVDGAYVDSYGYDSIDKWGRPIPDPDRWPSSRDGKGFAEVAKKVHGMGLKFGIHLMRGISTKAVDANAPILDVHTVFIFSFSDDLSLTCPVVKYNNCVFKPLRGKIRKILLLNEQTKLQQLFYDLYLLLGASIEYSTSQN